MIEWRPIPDTFYEASDDGRIRSAAHTVYVRSQRGDHYRSFKARILRNQKHPFGYPTVKLAYGDGTDETRTVHQLVMLAFHGPPPSGLEVMHADGDPKNARLENLSYGTPKQNNADKRQHGTDNRGIRHWNARLDESQVIEIRNLKGKMAATKIAAIYGITEGYVTQIIGRHCWKHV